MSKAKVVQYRRGNTAQNDAFTGEEAEIVVDTQNVTAIVHDGVQKGGYRLARADLSNVDTTVLTEETGHVGPALAQKNMYNVDTASLATSIGHAGNNLAYANLSNLEHTPSSTVGTAVSAILREDYKLASEDLSSTTTQAALKTFVTTEGLAHANAKDINTKWLAEGTSTTRDPSTLGQNLAYSDLSNVTTTANLASGRSGTSTDKNLAYADMGNVSLGTIMKDQYGVEFVTTAKQRLNSLISVDEVPLVANHVLNISLGNQVYLLENATNNLANASLTLNFLTEVTSDTLECYTYEIHIRCASVCPTLSWVESTGKEMRWMIGASTSPTSSNLTTIYTVRQQRGKIIVNLAGVY